MKTRLEKLVFVFLLVLASAVLLIGVNKPFNGHHDANNRMYREAAVGYLTTPITHHKFGQLVGGHFYTHHPPVLPLFLASSLAIFGDSFWSIRLVPIIFSVATLAVFYLLLRLFFTAKITIISLLFWMITPMFLYFGKMADHEALTLFFIVLAVYAFAKNMPKLVYLAVFLGQWTGWPAYYLAGILAVFMRSWLLIILSLANFALYLFHLTLLTGSPTGGGFFDIFLFRTGAKSSIGQVQETYTMQGFIRQQFSWAYNFYTPPQFLLTVFAILVSLYSFFKTKKLTLKLKVWFIFFFVAFVHVALFRTGANRHDYWLYYFLPFFLFWYSRKPSDFLKKDQPSQFSVFSLHCLVNFCLFKVTTILLGITN